MPSHAEQASSSVLGIPITSTNETVLLLLVQQKYHHSVAVPGLERDCDILKEVVSLHPSPCSDATLHHSDTLCGHSQLDHKSAQSVSSLGEACSGVSSGRRKWKNFLVLIGFQMKHKIKVHLVPQAPFSQRSVVLSASVDVTSNSKDFR